MPSTIRELLKERDSLRENIRPLMVRHQKAEDTIEEQLIENTPDYLQEFLNNLTGNEEPTTLEEGVHFFLMDLRHSSSGHFYYSQKLVDHSLPQAEMEFRLKELAECWGADFVMRFEELYNENYRVYVTWPDYEGPPSPNQFSPR